MDYIIEKEKCNGCHACFNACLKQCISMITDKEGFLQPVIDNTKCIDCGICKKICPVRDDVHNQIKTQPTAYAAYNKNEDIRMQSSSGGLFTLFAECIINKGGVAFGACFDETFNVKHDFVEKSEDLSKFRGSKYVQSIIGDTYKKAKDFLENGIEVFFTGTPCQIGGLFSYLGKDYENLTTQDIICHGVPSPKVWQKYVEYREHQAEAKLNNLKFRDKRNGWSNYHVSFDFNNKQQYLKQASQDSYMRAFLSDNCLRKSCYNCSFKNINRQADITLADFWGIDNIMPEMNDNKGISLLILNSKKGKQYFGEIKNSVIYKESILEEAIKSNPSMIKSVVVPKNRDKFMVDVDEVPFEQLVKKHTQQTILQRLVRLPRRLLRQIKNISLNIKRH